MFPHIESKMKKSILLSIFFVLFLFGLLGAKRHINSKKEGFEDILSKENGIIKRSLLRNGDLIFQTSLSSQSKAIQLATHSKYSHCGIVYVSNGKYSVFEAVQPVKTTPLDEWIARGKGKHFVVKRLKNAARILTPELIQKMKKEGSRLHGKNYDLSFEWSDEKIYCSELIWKIYQRSTGIEIGKLQKLGDFDLSNPIVKNKMKERYGNNIPTNEIVISPKAIFESELLVTVLEN